ncbi:MAG TPA: DUF6600 domain-containing protein [Myxococcota bacterium]|nr:DUF6600 domain-containing protein [Myxococcota bacterium]
MRQRRVQAAWSLALLFTFGAVCGAAAQEAPPSGFDRTPPRLGLADGPVAFWRTGAADWATAQVNTALAAGDRLATGSGGNLELQIGPHAFVRAGSDTQLGLDSLEPDFLQFRVTSGTASLDLRSMPPGQTIELGTPNAAFTVEHPGYYRVEVRDETTTFASRRGGRATVTPGGGQSASVGPSEEVVVTGGDAPQLETYAAPELDAWDRWNYERTDHQIDAVSARYVPPDVYGADDLDHDGQWRVVPNYGSVWIPGGVGPGWAPYTTGSWMYDPFFGWTWVDTAPWGWAPYHYGRWVHVGGFWGWAPGPIVVRPYYAPALVAFFGTPGLSVGVHIGLGFPAVGWVALGWGEPIVPWWGPPGFIGVAHWAGWGGPRVVNNVTINKTTIVNVNNITTYQNASVPGAVVAVKPDRFGQGPVAAARLAQLPQAQQFQPVHGALGVKPVAASLVGGASRAPVAPPQEALTRPVVATRAPQIAAPALAVNRGAPNKSAAGPPSAAGAPPGHVAAPVHVVTPPERGPASPAIARAPFGQNGSVERAQEPPPPHFQDLRSRESVPQAASASPASPRSAPSGAESARGAPPPAVPHANQPQPSFARPASQPTAMHRELPGEPANRVYQRQTPKSVAPPPARSEPSHAGGKPSVPAHGSEERPAGKEKRS